MSSYNKKLRNSSFNAQTLWLGYSLNCSTLPTKLPKKINNIRIKSNSTHYFFYYFRRFKKWLKRTIKAQFTNIDMVELLRYRWSLLRNKVCSAMTWNQWQVKDMVCKVCQIHKSLRLKTIVFSKVYMYQEGYNERWLKTYLFHPTRWRIQQLKYYYFTQYQSRYW